MIDSLIVISHLFDFIFNHFTAFKFTKLFTSQVLFFDDLLSLLFWKFVFLFFSVHATINSKRLGRLVNDSPAKEANSYVKVIDVDGIQHLCLFARHDIRSGTELRYDYGVPGLPWRQKCNQIKNLADHMFDCELMEEGCAEETREASTTELIDGENKGRVPITAAEEGEISVLKKSSVVDESFALSAIEEECEITAKETVVEECEQAKKDTDIEETCEISAKHIIGEESKLPAKEIAVEECEQAKTDTDIEEACEIIGEESEITARKTAVTEGKMFKKVTVVEEVIKIPNEDTSEENGGRPVTARGDSDTGTETPFITVAREIDMGEGKCLQRSRGCGLATFNKCLRQIRQSRKRPASSDEE